MPSLADACPFTFHFHKRAELDLQENTALITGGGTHRAGYRTGLAARGANVTINGAARGARRGCGRQL